MRRLLSLIALSIGTLPGHLFASETDSVKAHFNYNRDGLQIISVLIDDRGFFDEWRKPQTPKIKSVSIFRRGDEVIPIIIFSSSAKDSNGNADLSYDITVSKPDGSVYRNFEKLVIWKDAPAPQMHLIKEPIAIRLEQKDPLGIYKIKATVFENVRHSEVLIDLSFRVIEDSILTLEELTNQLTFFYRKHNVLLLPTLMRTVENAGILDKASARPAMLGFFTVAMSSITESQSLVKTIDQLDEGKPFFSYCYSLSSNRDTILNWEGHDASVNDMLWGAFFASGDRRFVERLVSEMRFCNEEDSVLLFLTGASAKWSLCSNAQQHPAVRTYLEAMVGKVPTELAGYLQEALNSDPQTLREQMDKGVLKFKNKN